VPQRPSAILRATSDPSRDSPARMAISASPFEDRENRSLIPGFDPQARVARVKEVEQVRSRQTGQRRTQGTLGELRRLILVARCQTRIQRRHRILTRSA